MDLDDKLFKDRSKIKEEVENFCEKRVRWSLRISIVFLNDYVKKTNDMLIMGLIPIEKGCFGIGVVFFSNWKNKFFSRYIL
ncbi:MAG: hypothetical protein J7L47_02680 [Candidatus Odinarchaeota archaeon]|nr:hypothetical protein [Candidatus Odinarchaeota archaeon]